MKKTLLVRKSVDSPRRRFVYNDSAEESFTKIGLTSPNIKLTKNLDIILLTTFSAEILRV